MGLTKQYLAYRHAGSFNIIASGRSNISFATYNRIDGRYILSGGAENAILWDLRLGEKILELKRDKFEVTTLRPSPDRVHVSVGYSDGAVVVFDLKTQSTVCSLAMHKTAVNILRYDKLGMRLASGGQDTDVVISDMVTQMGLCRLVGHNAPVTDVHFMEHFGFDDVVVSTSKDTQIKFWNVETQNCFKTIVDNRTEVWGLGLVGEFLVSGCGNNAMNVYRIKRRDQSDTAGITGLVEGLSIDDDDSISPFTVGNCGSIQRAGKGRVVNLVMDESGRVLSCHGTNDLIENFYVCSKEEAMSRLAKRKKKLSTDEQLGRNDVSLADEIKRLPSIKTGTKIKSLDVLIGLNDELRVIVNNANNSLKLFSINIKQKKSEATLLKTIAQCGHQSEVRNICFSSDSLALVSGSAESLKVWNRETMQCLRTIETDYILSSCFVPGDRHVILGTKTGQLLIVDIANGEILEEIPAHKGELWSICLLPDLKGCVTGSGDTTVKFWHFELIESQNNADESSSKTKVLSLLHKNTLKLEETVLCVRTSPNGKFIAVGLLDSTVKIFFLDSLKFYLSLYGHKLPVLCMDISYDSTLIATGSADRNVKIWGLDFGDCHKSLFAHDDSVMGLQFIPKTHMFFTCGKDGKIKQWDADIFQKVMTFPGHIGEAYGLSVSSNGLFVSSCGSDRTIRIYERTDEPIVLQDVQEEEREEQENQTLATGDDNAVPTLPGLKLPSRKTVGAEQAAESIIECLDICKEFDPDSKELHPLMQAHEASTPDDFLIAVLQRIRVADIEEALIIIPFSYVCQMMQRMPELVNKRKDQTELISKIVFFLFQLHHKQIVSNQTLLPIIAGLVKNLEAVLVNLRDMIGMNYHGLQLLQRDIESQEGIDLFRDATQAKRQRDKKMKKRQLVKRLHVHLS